MIHIAIPMNFGGGIMLSWETSSSDSHSCYRRLILPYSHFGWLSLHVGLHSPKEFSMRIRSLEKELPWPHLVPSLLLLTLLLVVLVTSLMLRILYQIVNWSCVF